MLSFPELGVGARVARRLGSLGISSPLPIQAETIPAALAGRDICGRAPTGCGKTLAFGIPVVEGAHSGGPRRPGALVLVPTRELADQVANVIAPLLVDPQRVVALYGGKGYETQRRALRRGVDIVVACPGRLEDLLERGDVRLDDVDVVVIDEADRMVDMGFLQPVRRLLDRTATRRQVLLYSATLGSEVESLVRQYLHDPLRCDVGADDEADVTHLFWKVPRPDRIAVTARIIAQQGQGFIFCRTKRAADRVARQLRAEGVDAVPMHGDRSQEQRARALAAFAAGRLPALVATDVVARGIHIDDVPCVVHFDPPSEANGYVHRSGRTGRSGRPGVVVSLVPEDLRQDVRQLQRSLGFPAEFTSPFEAGWAAAATPPPEPERRLPQARRSPRPPTATKRTGDDRLSGNVKFFDTARGYGFLSGPGGADIFVHHSRVRAAGARRPALRKGDAVSFLVGPGRRGQEAHDVAAEDRGAA